MTRSIGGQFFSTCPKCGSTATAYIGEPKWLQIYNRYICSVCKFNWKMD